MYIVLSGFITHLAYGSKTFNTVGEACKFYLRRFGRIWLTFYLSLALGFVQRSLTHQLGPVEEYALPLLLLDSWFPVYRSQLLAKHPPLNSAGWTLSTLTLPWVLYPALNAAFRRVPARVVPVLGLMLLFSVTATAPALVMFLVRKGKGLGETPGELISGDEFMFLYIFPPSRLSEFLLGMASSQLLALLKVDGKLAWPHWQWVGWASAAAIVVTSASVPTDPNWRPNMMSHSLNGAAHLGRVDQEALFISIFSPAWALVIIAANAQAQDSSLVRTLRHPVVSSIGGYSFAVYLFQYLWYYAWVGAEASNVPGISPGIYAAYLPGFLLTLWLSAGVWSELVEAPFATALKELLTDEVKQPKVSEADDPSTPPVAVPGRFRALLHTSLRVGLAFVVGVSILLLMYWLPSPTEDASMTDEPATNPAALANFTRMANAIATVVTNGTSGLPLRLGVNVLQPAH
jgi:peptidoglycan/LPS O-acetylase OafA/YrhL